MVRHWFRLATLVLLVSVLVGAVALVGASQGCGGCNPKPRYGPEYNSQRIARGIPIIPTGWYIYDGVMYDKTSWVNPPFNRGKWDERSGIHAGKDVGYDKSQILWEADVYYSGRKYMSSDPDCGLVDEEMIVTYSYSAEREGKLVWDCDVLAGPLEGHHTFDEGQRILRQWGIPEGEIPRVPIEARTTW